MNITGKIYTITQAAELCGINRTTLWRWIKSGKLLAYQTPTGQYRIKKDDLENFIEKELRFLDPPTPKEPDRILIIDDDAAFRKFVRRVLSRASWETNEASNGFQAGLKIMKFLPSLLILDVFMPEMDGFDICRQIKADPHTKNVKIIAVSGFGTPEVKEKILKLGADIFLEKPLNKKTLLKCVKDLISVQL